MGISQEQTDWSWRLRKTMSEPILHECGIAMIRLLKPLEYYLEKYGTATYGLNKLYLLMEKQHNRGQDGAGIANIKFDVEPGNKFISRERSNADAPIKAVFDKDKKKIKEFSKYFNCSETSSEKLFFKQNFKICYISTPSGSHFKDILKCFKNNKHVVVEKPPVLKIKQLLFLSKFAKRKKLNFFVIYQNRENKSVKFVKKFLDQNKNDKIVLVNLNLLWSRPQKYYSNH